MQGQILGISGSEGAIKGEDGKRYSFARDEWKGEREPRAGEAVDFVEASEGVAAAIYPLKRAAGADLGAVLQGGGESLSRLASSEGASKAIDRIKAAPAIAIAAAILIVSILFSYIEFSLAGDESGHSLVGFGFGGSSELGDLADYARERAENAWLMTEEDRNVLRGVAVMLDGIGYLALSLLLVPICAAWTIFQALKEKPTRKAEIATIAAVVWSVAFFFIAQEMLAGSVEALNYSAETIRDGWSMGFGGYLLVVLAILSVAKLKDRLFPKKAPATA